MTTVHSSEQPSDSQASTKTRAKRRWRLGRDSSRPPWFFLGVIVTIVIAGVFAPLVAPHGPYQGDLSSALTPPFFQDGGELRYLLGTDELGRDILSRLVFGSRVSVVVAAASILIAGVLGSALGMIAGYAGGLVDAVVMRLVEATLALPTFLVALALGMIYRPSLTIVVGVISLLLWGYYARQARSECLGLRDRDFVALARISGASSSRILMKHLAPNVAPSLTIIAAYQVGLVVSLEASLSFLGFGVPPPTPSWGSVISDGQPLLGSAWWVATMPALLLILFVASINITADWLQTRFNSRIKIL